ncbi:endoribonuclease dcr-1 [Lucilia cuprina]|uniref:endoribonuclease dcr-1 n=1 Tax=Lucilia cuprina TaxID=7375 RepID=UPI001F054EF5|nr:endoribonuclease dcr-1 [Lucilia cuprina]
MDEEGEQKQCLKARPYQLELLEYVCKRNGIIYLPTGAGKTFIAVLALKRFSAQLRETIQNGGKRAIFMCNTVELARQQFKVLQKTTNLEIGLYIGERDVDNWTRRQWETEIQKKQVLVGTAQIFLDIVNQNLIKITDLSIVIIDECHHATGNHPMHEFLSAFQYCDQSKLPRVIGLTGVIIKGNKLGQVIQELNKLEATFRGNIVTIQDLEQMKNVMVYSTKPIELMVTFSSHSHSFHAVEKVKQIIANCVNVIKNFDIGIVPQKMSKSLASLRAPNKKSNITNLLNDFIYQMEDFGLYTASIAIMSPIIEFEVKKRQAETLALRNLYRFVIQCCERVRHIIVNELKSLLDDDETDWNTLEIIENFSTPKLKSLFGQLKEKFAGKQADDIACLLFVERRYTAKCVYYVIKNYITHIPQLKNALRPQFMVGRQSILYSIESILDTKWNQKAIDEFRCKQCNIIICSNVLEEGIDVQACNYVFAFDPLKTFNSYIQTKGRARSSNSYYTVFINESEKMQTLQKIKTYRETHELIKQFLSSRTLDRDDPNEEEIAKQFVELIPPFIIPSGARLIASSALALLHRYCQTLPWDSFGSSQPWYNKLPPNNDGKIAVTVCLPLQSTVREVIVSDYFPTTKEAKISAAFKACVKLYENGELNHLLLPFSKTECIAKVSDNLFEHWKKYNDDITQLKQAAGKQLKRTYERQCPDELKSSLPRLGQKAYAYAMEFSTDFETNTYNEHIVKYLGTKTTYALLLNKKLPKLAKMPLFMSQGKLHVKISEQPIECVIQTEEQLKQLQQFHTMLFRDLLRLWKEFLVVDRRDEENSYLIIPLDEISTIDWQLIKKFQHLNPCRKYTHAERQNAQYRPQDYLNKVVTKWYTDLQYEDFVVTKVREDLTPLSQFDNKQYGTYADFYSSRYSMDITNKKQFLLEVKSLTQRRNFFNNASNKSNEKRKELNKIILIPELCHNYKYPADLWLKALFLPTILHRVYYMLHAEALRKRINKYLNLDKYFNNYSPQPLKIDESLKRVLDDDGNLVKEKEHPKKVLVSLPTKKQTTANYKVCPLNTEETAWKDYLEPVDFSRKLDMAYPIEIDYYYKFIMSLIPEVENLRLNEEMEYSKSQFDMPIMTPEVSTSERAFNDNIKQLAIKDASTAEKIEIEMLKRNFEPDHSLKSAEQYEFLAAITAARVNDVFDMERYELLGDAFLKFSTSLYLANKYTNWHEGFLTIVKGRMVSNRNLLYCMNDSNICQMICSTLFNPNASWVPPLASLPSNLLELLKKKLPAASTLSPSDFYSLQLTEEEILSGKCSAEKLERFDQACIKNQELVAGNVEIDLENDMNIFINRDVIRDKIVADTLEALLGVCVKNYGIHRSFRMLEFFGICKGESQSSLVNLLDLKLCGSQLRANISKKEIDGFLGEYKYLERNLGYTFRDRAYLLQALTHPSYPTNRLTGCYQELEFIGDAIIDMLITCYIFERHQNMNPGKMTDLRMALVNNITLGCICVRHKFHLFLLSENSALFEAIKTFADFQESQNYRVTDQVRILMEENNDSINPFNDILNDSNNEEDNSENDDEDMERTEHSEWPHEKKAYNLAKNVDVPKALGDIVEALIAAVYLDCRNLDITWQVIYNLMKFELEEFSRNVPIDPVRQLEENKQAKPKYKPPVIDNNDVMVECVFNCLDKLLTTHGFGCNAKQAKKAAAKQALQILAKHSN